MLRVVGILVASLSVGGCGVDQPMLGELPTASVDQPMSVETIQTVEDLSSAAGLDGDIVFARGFYASGDGGGGHFEYDASSTETEVPGYIICPTFDQCIPTGRWKRVINTNFLDVRWFGATPDGGGPDDVGFQTARDVAWEHKRHRIHIPGGEFHLTETLLFQEVWGLVIQGAGRRFTRVTWQGGNGIPMFAFRDASECVLENFSLGATPAYPLDTAIQFENAPEFTTWAPTGHILRHIEIEGTNRIEIEGVMVAGLQVGIRWIEGDGPGGDANNDRTTLVNVSVRNYEIAAYSLEHGQSKGNRFINCECSGLSPEPDGTPISQACVTTMLGANTGGGFSWEGGGGGPHQVDFHMWPNDATSIVNGNFEASDQFLVVPGPTGVAFPVTVQTNRWSDANVKDDEDGLVVISYAARGPLILQGNTIGEEWDIPITVHVNMGAEDSFVAMGNTFASNAPVIFTGAKPQQMANNRFDAPGAAMSMATNRISDVGPLGVGTRYPNADATLHLNHEGWGVGLLFTDLSQGRRAMLRLAGGSNELLQFMGESGLVGFQLGATTEPALTLRDSGNVGVGMFSPVSKLQLGEGFLQLPTTVDDPPASECGALVVWGRMAVRSGNGETRLFICGDSLTGTRWREFQPIP